MMQAERSFRIGFRITCAALFVLIAFRCALVPFSHDEVATFMYYIQCGDFLPFLSHVDANNHFLTSATGWICFKLFGSSPFALRVPELLGFLFLCAGVAKVNRLLETVTARMVNSALFLLCFNFLCFYSLCRGYALSMSFLVIACGSFLSYLRYGMRGDKLLLFLFLQLALSANLTLVMVTLLLSGVVAIADLMRRARPAWYTLLAWLVHAGLTYLWVRYAFFLQEQGALYYGGGESYWQVTFMTLIETLFGFESIAAVIFIALFALMLFFAARRLLTHKLKQGNGFLVMLGVLLALITGFYLMKALLGINYPEDRTGLFFYVFFAIALALLTDKLPVKAARVMIVIPALCVLTFVMNFDLRHHPWRIYETMPESFHQILVKEQQSRTEPLTIAGHRVRELFYGFMNYNSQVKTSHMTAPEALQANCDFALGYKADAPYYQKYFNVLATDDHSGFVLLRRKQPADHGKMTETAGITASGTPEYVNAIEVLDTLMTSDHPLEAYFDISFRKAPVPLNAWLVLEVRGEGDSAVTVRTPLNLLQYDWNSSRIKTKLTSGNIPHRVKRIVAYLWNIEKKEIDFTFERFRLYQLYGEGVNEASQAEL